MNNPFLNRKVIKDPAAFYGRQEELAKLYALIDSMQTCSVVGPRRIGKSSLLYQLVQPGLVRKYLPEPEKYLFAYVDLQELAGLGPDDFFLTLAERIRPTAAGKLEVELSRHSNLAGFRRLLMEISEIGLRLVVCLDEFEMLSTNASFGSGFFTSLRGLASNYNFILITSSRTSLFDLCHAGSLQTSEFWNIFVEMRLGLMPRSECLELLNGSFERAGLDPRQENWDWLLDFTGCHPFYIQHAASIFYDRLTQAQAISLPEVLEATYQEARRHYEYSMKQVSEREKSVLLQLAGAAVPLPVESTIFHDLQGQALVQGKVEGARLFSTGFQKFLVQTFTLGKPEVPKNVVIPAIQPPPDKLESVTQRIQYKDFDVKVEMLTAQSCRVLVMNSPAGQTQAICSLPFNLENLGEVLIRLGRQVNRGGSKGESLTTVSPLEVGEGLYDAIFAGEIGEIFFESLGEVRSRQEGLRVKIHTDPDHSPHLASLPWEYLYNSRKRSFLSLNRYTPIIRYLDVHAKTTLEQIDPPLRVLVAISSPFGLPALNLELEREYVQSAWGNLPSVQVHFMEDATPAELQASLWDFKPHVLHFMGHGMYNPATGMGELVFMDEDRRAKSVSGRQLGVLLANTPSMKLAVLNACQTAQLPKSNELDPFSGVAAAIVMAGLPAVVAMQFPITDQAALIFANKFYSRLILGDPVDVAVAFGREAIHLELSESMEWGTPVLFMRVPDGRLFELRGDSPFR